MTKRAFFVRLFAIVSIACLAPFKGKLRIEGVGFDSLRTKFKAEFGYDPSEPGHPVHILRHAIDRNDWWSIIETEERRGDFGIAEVRCGKYGLIDKIFV